MNKNRKKNTVTESAAEAKLKGLLSSYRDRYTSSSSSPIFRKK